MVLRKRFVQEAECVQVYVVRVEVETEMPKENVVLVTVLRNAPSQACRRGHVLVCPL